MCTPSLHVFVYIFTYKVAKFTCVSVSVYICAHRVCRCRYICLHICKLSLHVFAASTLHLGRPSKLCLIPPSPSTIYLLGTSYTESKWQEKIIMSGQLLILILSKCSQRIGISVSTVNPTGSRQSCPRNHQNTRPRCRLQARPSLVGLFVRPAVDCYRPKMQELH